MRFPTFPLECLLIRSDCSSWLPFGGVPNPSFSSIVSLTVVSDQRRFTANLVWGLIRCPLSCSKNCITTRISSKSLHVLTVWSAVLDGSMPKVGYRGVINLTPNTRIAGIPCPILHELCQKLVVVRNCM